MLGAARGFAVFGDLRFDFILRLSHESKRAQLRGYQHGCVVGAAYTSGNTVGEMVKLIEGTSIDLPFRDKPPR
jgi:hypothetical protein